MDVGDRCGRRGCPHVMLFLFFLVQSLCSSSVALGVTVTFTLDDDYLDAKKAGKKATNAVRRLIDPVVETYESFTPKGKFATGAAVGFTSSRCAVKATVGVVKVAGVAFVVSETLQFVGDLGKEGLSEENKDMIQNVKMSFTRAADECKARMRRYVSPGEIKACIANYVEKDKYGAAGFASGAVLGLLL